MELVLDANGGLINGFTSLTETLAYGETDTIYTLPVPTREGCVFSGWAFRQKWDTNTENPDLINGDYTLDKTTDNGKVTLYAIWSYQYKVLGVDEVFDENGDLDLVYTFGSIAFSGADKKNYKFVGFKLLGEDGQPTGEKITSPYQITETTTRYNGVVVLKPIYEAHKRTINFNLNYGTNIHNREDNKIYKDGVLVSLVDRIVLDYDNPSGNLPVLEMKDGQDRVNYIFKGWSLDNDGSADYTIENGTISYTLPIDSEGENVTKTLYAIWEAENVTLNLAIVNPNRGTIKLDGEDVVSVTAPYGTEIQGVNTDKTIKIGSGTDAKVVQVALNKNQDYLYNFSINIAVSGNQNKDKLDHDTVVTVNFIETNRLYNIKLDLNGANAEDQDNSFKNIYDNVSTSQNQTIGINIPVRDHYTFKGWSIENDGSADYTVINEGNIEFTMPQTDWKNEKVEYVLYAVWELKNYEFELSFNRIGDEVTGLQIPYVSGRSEGETYSAEFPAKTTLTYNTSTGSGKAGYEKYATLSAGESGSLDLYHALFSNSKQEYRIQSVEYFNGSEWEIIPNGASLSLLGDLKLRVNYEAVANTFTIKYVDVAGGEYYNNPKMVEELSDISFVATEMFDVSEVTNSNYEFKGWAYAQADGSYLNDDAVSFVVSGTYRYEDLENYLDSYSDNTIYLAPVWEAKDVTTEIVVGYTGLENGYYNQISKITVNGEEFSATNNVITAPYGTVITETEENGVYTYTIGTNVVKFETKDYYAIESVSVNNLSKKSNWDGNGLGVNFDVVFKTYELVTYPNYNSQAGTRYNITCGLNGAERELASPTRNGYKFLGWATDSNAVAPDSGYEYTNDTNIVFTLSADTCQINSLYAVWESVSVSRKINIVNPEFGTVKLGGQEITSDTDITANYDTDVSYSGNSISIGDQIITITPNEEDFKQHYTVSISGIPQSNGKWTDETSITITFTRVYKEYKVTLNVPTDASITPDNYIISYNPNDAQKYSVTFNNANRKGYTFLGWSKTQNSSTAEYLKGEAFSMPEHENDFLALNVKENDEFTLYAVWEANAEVNTIAGLDDYGKVWVKYGAAEPIQTREITADYGSKVVVDEDNGTITIGEGENVIVVSAIPNDSTFKEVYLISTITSNSTTWSDSTELTVEFAREYEHYVANLALNGGTAIGTAWDVSYDPTAENYEIDLPIPSKTGYSFQGWSTTNDNTVEYSGENFRLPDTEEGFEGLGVNGSLEFTLYAVWQANDVDIQLNIVNPSYGSVKMNGEDISVVSAKYDDFISISGNTIKIGDQTIIVSANAETKEAKYSIVSIDKNGQDYCKPGVSISIVFAREYKDYTITLDTNSNGEATIGQTSYTFGYDNGAVALNTPTREHYVFRGWSMTANPTYTQVDLTEQNFATYQNSLYIGNSYTRTYIDTFDKVDSTKTYYTLDVEYPYNGTDDVEFALTNQTEDIYLYAIWEAALYDVKVVVSSKGNDKHDTAVSGQTIENKTYNLKVAPGQEGMPVMISSNTYRYYNIATDLYFNFSGNIIGDFDYKFGQEMTFPAVLVEDYYVHSSESNFDVFVEYFIAGDEQYNLVFELVENTEAFKYQTNNVSTGKYYGDPTFTTTETKTFKGYDKVTFPSVVDSKNNYELIGWTYTDGKKTADFKAGKEYTIAELRAMKLNVSSENPTLNIYPVWEAKSYNVQIAHDGKDANDNVHDYNGDDRVENKKYGTEYTLPADLECKDAGFYLAGYIVNGVEEIPGETIIVEGDTTITPVWGVAYAITFDVNNAYVTGPRSKVGYVEPDENITTLNALLTEAGFDSVDTSGKFTFLGWSETKLSYVEDASSVQAQLVDTATSITFDKAKTYYAVWQVNSVTYTIRDNKGYNSTFTTTAMHNISLIEDSFYVYIDVSLENDHEYPYQASYNSAGIARNNGDAGYEEFSYTIDGTDIYIEFTTCYFDFTISFVDADWYEGNPKMSSIPATLEFKGNETKTLPTNVIDSTENYEFKGWTHQPGLDTVSLEAGAVVDGTINQITGQNYDIVLYPVWEVKAYTANVSIEYLNEAQDPNAEGYTLEVDNTLFTSIYGVVWHNQYDSDNRVILYELGQAGLNGMLWATMNHPSYSLITKDSYYLNNVMYKLPSDENWTDMVEFEEYNFKSNVEIKFVVEAREREYNIKFEDSSGEYPGNPIMASKPIDKTVGGYDTLTLPSVTDSTGMYNHTGWTDGTTTISVNDMKDIGFDTWKSLFANSSTATLRPVWEKIQYSVTFTINEQGTKYFPEYSTFSYSFNNEFENGGKFDKNTVLTFEDSGNTILVYPGDNWLDHILMISGSGSIGTFGGYGNSPEGIFFTGTDYRIDGGEWAEFDATQFTLNGNVEFRFNYEVRENPAVQFSFARYVTAENAGTYPDDAYWLSYAEELKDYPQLSTIPQLMTVRGYAGVVDGVEGFTLPGSADWTNSTGEYRFVGWNLTYEAPEIGATPQFPIGTTLSMKDIPYYPDGNNMMFPVWAVNTYEVSLDINVIDADNGNSAPKSGIAVPTLSNKSDADITALEHGTLLSLDSFVSNTEQTVNYSIDGTAKFAINVSLQAGKIYQDWYEYIDTEYSLDGGETWITWNTPITLSQDLMVRSNWKVSPRDFSVTFFDVDDGKYQENPKMTTKPNDIYFDGYASFTLPTATNVVDSKGLYYLDGWAYSEAETVKVFDAGANIDFDKIDSSKFSSDKLTLKPVWKLNEFTLTLSSSYYEEGFDYEIVALNNISISDDPDAGIMPVYVDGRMIGDIGYSGINYRPVDQYPDYDYPSEIKYRINGGEWIEYTGSIKATGDVEIYVTFAYQEHQYEIEYVEDTITWIGQTYAPKMTSVPTLNSIGGYGTLNLLSVSDSTGSAEFDGWYALYESPVWDEETGEDLDHVEIKRIEIPKDQMTGLTYETWKDYLFTEFDVNNLNENKQAKIKLMPKWKLKSYDIGGDIYYSQGKLEYEADPEITLNGSFDLSKVNYGTILTAEETYFYHENHIIISAKIFDENNTDGTVVAEAMKISASSPQYNSGYKYIYSNLLMQVSTDGGTTWTHATEVEVKENVKVRFSVGQMPNTFEYSFDDDYGANIANASGFTLTEDNLPADREGHVFKGWKVSSNGKTRTYNVGDTISWDDFADENGYWGENPSIRLESQWEAVLYTVYLSRIDAHIAQNGYSYQGDPFVQYYLNGELVQNTEEISLPYGTKIESYLNSDDEKGVVLSTGDKLTYVITENDENSTTQINISILNDTGMIYEDNAVIELLAMRTYDDLKIYLVNDVIENDVFGDEFGNNKIYNLKNITGSQEYVEQSYLTQAGYVEFPTLVDADGNYEFLGWAATPAGDNMPSRIYTDATIIYDEDFVGYAYAIWQGREISVDFVLADDCEGIELVDQGFTARYGDIFDISQGFSDDEGINSADLGYFLSQMDFYGEDSLTEEFTINSVKSNRNKLWRMIVSLQGIEYDEEGRVFIPLVDDITYEIGCEWSPYEVFAHFEHIELPDGIVYGETHTIENPIITVPELNLPAHTHATGWYGGSADSELTPGQQLNLFEMTNEELDELSLWTEEGSEHYVLEYYSDACYNTYNIIAPESEYFTINSGYQDTITYQDEAFDGFNIEWEEGYSLVGFDLYVGTQDEQAFVGFITNNGQDNFNFNLSVLQYNIKDGDNIYFKPYVGGTQTLYIDFSLSETEQALGQLMIGGNVNNQYVYSSVYNELAGYPCVEDIDTFMKNNQITRENYHLIGFSTTKGATVPDVYTTIDEYGNYTGALSWSDGETTYYPVWEGNERTIVSPEIHSSPTFEWLGLDAYKSYVKTYRQGEAITLPTDPSPIQALEYYQYQEITGFRYNGEEYLPGATIIVNTTDDDPYFAIEPIAINLQAYITYDLNGGTGGFVDGLYDLGTQFDNGPGYVTPPDALHYHNGWEVYVNGVLDPSYGPILKSTTPITVKAIFEERVIGYSFDQSVGTVPNALYEFTGNDIVLNWQESDFVAPDGYKLSHFELDRNGVIETAQLGGTFYDVIGLIPNENTVYGDVSVKPVFVKADQLLTFHTTTTPDQLECEMKVPAGKNLLDISGRTLGTLSSGFENNNTRQFEIDKYYVGLSSGNYYSPTSVTYSIDNNTVTVKTNLSAYGLAFPVKVKPNVKYVCNTAIRMNFYTASGEYISWGQTAAGQTFTAPSNCEIVTIILTNETLGETKTFTDIQLQEGADVSNYEVYSSKTAIEKVEKSKVTATTLLFKGAKFTIPSATETEKIIDGVKQYFVGWSTDGDSSTVEYYPGETWTYDANSALDFYPVYEKASDEMSLEFEYSEDTDSYSVIGVVGEYKTHYVVPATFQGKPVTLIDSVAFNTIGCDVVKQIVLPDTLTTIANDAFYRCGITSITIPASVTRIGIRAFQFCNNLNSVIFEEGSKLENLESYVFSGCASLRTINLPSLDYLPEGIFMASGIESFTIPETVRTIGPDAFAGCSNLSSIVIPEGVTDLPFGLSGNVGMFNYCVSLVSVTIPASIKTIGENAFYFCTNLKSVIFEENSQLESIGDNAFEECSSLTEINLPEGLKSLDAVVFRACTSLKSIVIPEGVTFVGANIFQNCTALEEISIPSTLSIIPADFVSGCTSLKQVNFAENSQLNTIALNAFYNCSYLEMITIPAGVTSIAANAFYGCENLKIVINLSDLDIVKGADTHGMVAKYADLVVTDPDYEIYSENGATCCSHDGEVEMIGLTDYSIENFEIPNNVTVINNSAFVGANNLKTLSIPASVKDVNSNLGCPFMDLESLESVVFASDSPIEVIPTGTFYGCKALKSVTLPEGLTRIDGCAFEGCSSLTSITIPAGVTSIGSSAFAGCENLKVVNNLSNLNIVKGADTHGMVAKYADLVVKGGELVEENNILYHIKDGDVIALTMIDKTSTICNLRPDTTIIGDSAFMASNIESVVIPASVEKIYNCAFGAINGCTFTFEANSKLSFIGATAFYCVDATVVNFPEGNWQYSTEENGTYALVDFDIELLFSDGNEQSHYYYKRVE
ncbi:MAG: leucine-rich repeat protein [Clostridia bacterium]|nr:leucine-rich repeat protein [Clostridia bacterium]